MARKRKEEPPVDIQVPITPMLDMSFQLLSFFLLTFRPMPTEGQLSINLPKLDAATDPSVPPPEMSDQQDQYTIYVHSSAGGTVALMGLKGPTVNLEDIKDFQSLYSQLKAIPKPADRGPAGITITIEAANELNYAQLVEIMNLCKMAGYESVNLMPLRRT